MPVVPTDREKHENESAHVANRSPRARQKIPASIWRTSRRWTADSLLIALTADLVANTMLIQNFHSVAGARQLSYEAPESHAVNCVLENPDANGLGRVLLKGDVGSAAQTLVDPVWVGRGQRMMQRRVRGVCISQVVWVRLMSERSRVRRRPMISCRHRSSDAEPTAKALFRRGLLDAWRACSIGPRSITTCALGRR